MNKEPDFVSVLILEQTNIKNLFSNKNNLTITKWIKDKFDRYNNLLHITADESSEQKFDDDDESIDKNFLDKKLIKPSNKYCILIMNIDKKGNEYTNSQNNLFIAFKKLDITFSDVNDELFIAINNANYITTFPIIIYFELDKKNINTIADSSVNYIVKLLNITEMRFKNYC